MPRLGKAYLKHTPLVQPVCKAHSCTKKIWRSDDAPALCTDNSFQTFVKRLPGQRDVGGPSTTIAEDKDKGSGRLLGKEMNFYMAFDHRLVEHVCDIPPNMESLEGDQIDRAATPPIQTTWIWGKDKLISWAPF